MLFNRIHRQCGMVRFRRSRDYAPRLCNRVDFALVALVRTQRCAVVVIAAPIPLAVPACAFERQPNGRCALPPARRAGAFVACLRIGRECRYRREQKPGQPDAFAAALFTDAVHAIVPVAGTDQRQAVRAQREADIERTRAVLVQTGLTARDSWLETRFSLHILERGALDDGES